MLFKKIDETIKESFYSDFDVSASYGVAKRSECGSLMETLILADERLYEKKNAG